MRVIVGSSSDNFKDSLPTLAAQRSREEASPLPRALFQTSPSRLLLLVFCSFLSYWFFSHFVVRTVIVQGRSMTPALREGRRYLLNCWPLHFRQPRRGELVVFRDPVHNAYSVKRVIGVPGDLVQMPSGVVYLNGAPLCEPYLAPETCTLWPEEKEKAIRLSRDQFFLLGDNRDNSEDSRRYGPIPSHLIIGVLWQ